MRKWTNQVQRRLSKKGYHVVLLEPIMAARSRISSEPGLCVAARRAATSECKKKSAHSRRRNEFASHCASSRRSPDNSERSQPCFGQKSRRKERRECVRVPSSLRIFSVFNSKGAPNPKFAEADIRLNNQESSRKNNCNKKSSKYLLCARF